MEKYSVSSVNGITASSTGDVTISTGGGSFQSMVEAGGNLGAAVDLDGGLAYGNYFGGVTGSRYIDWYLYDNVNTTGTSLMTYTDFTEINNYGPGGVYGGLNITGGIVNLYSQSMGGGANQTNLKFTPALALTNINIPAPIISGTYTLATENQIAIIVVTEGGNTGYRLSSVNPDNYGNIGLDAVDLSYSGSPSSTMGAVGESSFNTGIQNISSGYASSTFGYLNTNASNSGLVSGTNNQSTGYINSILGVGHNVTGTNISVVGQASNIISESTLSSNIITSPVFVVGNGTVLDGDPDYSVTTRSDAFIVRKNGSVEAPSLTNGFIDSATGSILVTKDWVQLNSPATKESIGLGNVDNTSDLDKPISTAVSLALDGKLNIIDYNDRFKGVYLTIEALNLAHPTGIAGDSAQVNEVGATDVVNYSWDAEENIWVQSGASGSGATNTDALPEGTTNLYFTTARVLSTLINGVSFLIGTPIVSTDTILQALGKLQKQISDNLVSIGLKQNTLTNPLTGVGSELDPTTYALQDGTTLYHSVKWFTPTSTISTSGTTVTSVGNQFTSAMVGTKLTINGEWRIITAFTSTTVVTVASAYSQNYSGVVAGNWGIYSRAFVILSNGNIMSYTTTNITLLEQSSSSDSIFYKDFQFTGTKLGVLLGAQTGFMFQNSALLTSKNSQIKFTSGYWNSEVDVAIRRNSAGVLEIYDGITATGLEANRRDLLARNATASQYKLNALNTAPASATASGTLGEIRVTDTHIYVCTATNTWVRTALTTW